jgi:hypothetical protein
MAPITLARRRSRSSAPRTTNEEKRPRRKVKKAKFDGDKKVEQADLGPVRYLASLLGADNETVLKWFILVVALLLDPAVGSDANSVVSAKAQDGVQGGCQRPPEPPSRRSEKCMGEAS